MTLYHFTGEAMWQEIAAAGEIISPAEKERRDPEPGPLEWDLLGDEFSHLVVPSKSDEHYYWQWLFQELHDEFVWLTTHHLPPLGRTLPIRIQVEVADAQRWRAYARERKIPPSISEALGDTGPGRYYVADRPIPRAEWVAVERLPADVVDICAAFSGVKAARHLAKRTWEPETLWRASAVLTDEVPVPKSAERAA